jgi:hypothetical protein
MQHSQGTKTVVTIAYGSSSQGYDGSISEMFREAFSPDSVQLVGSVRPDLHPQFRG